MRVHLPDRRGISLLPLGPFIPTIIAVVMTRHGQLGSGRAVVRGGAVRMSAGAEADRTAQGPAAWMSFPARSWPVPAEYTIQAINLVKPTFDHGGMEDICAILGRNLRMWRHKRQLTQEELQAATGVSQQYLSELENGARNPSLRMVARIADALGLQAVELLRPDPPKP